MFLAPKGCLEARPCLLDPAPDDDEDDDAGSSRLFQPHRTLGLLTSSRPRMSDNRRSSLFSSNFGKFHLQGRTQSSDESFLTVPIGERFQILTLSKLVPVLVSRALPPSAAHHRRRRRSSRGGEGSHRYEGGDEEEAHKAVSDSSLSVTVATHGPRVLGRAVSVTLFSRTRPIACLDAFPFARRVDAKKGDNALLFAIVCARGDSSGAPRPREDGAGGGNDDVRGGGGEADDDVLIVGEDSEDESSVDGRKVDEGAESDPSDDASGDDDDDEGSSSSGGSMKSLDDAPKGCLEARPCLLDPAPDDDEDDDAGSSRLFQPHRTLGLLTSSRPRMSDNRRSSLFSSNFGKFHLQGRTQSSDESFLTVPIGERFQILTLSKLVPVLVSRALPPSAAHHRRRRRSSRGGEGSHRYEGGDEEEAHKAVSDSSLSVTVATHGPRVLGRAVSVTLFSRTRPIACLDAFPFARRVDAKKRGTWGIVDVIDLGRHRVDMRGEKEGRSENALLFAIVCARGDSSGAPRPREDGAGGGNDDVRGGGGEADDDVLIVGEDSEDESSVDGRKVDEGAESDPSDDASGDDDDDEGSSSSGGSMKSLDDVERIPPEDCYGRVLIVQASQTSLKIIKVIDLSGIGSNFVPYARRQEEEDERQNFTITAMSQSPAVDTIAVGTSHGSVHLVNLLHDLELFSLRHKPKRHHGKAPSMVDNINAVSSISFRTDGNATRMGVALLAVGCDDGSVSIWDLTPVEDETTGIVRRTLLTKMEGSHHGGICKLEYLPGEPLLLLTGMASNSILLHVFDAPDHSGRILRQRRGHISPPRILRYLHPGLSGGGILANAADGTDASSCQILSCGGPGDLSLRLFSTARSNLDKEYSQGPGLEKKARKFGKAGPEGRAELLLPEVIALASSEARSRDWGDLVTIHRDHAMAYVWSTRRGSQTGMPVLRQPQWNKSAMKDRPPRSASATSLAISACGNFALVGTLEWTPTRIVSPGCHVLTDEEERQRKRGLKFAGDVGRTMRMLEKNANKGGTMPSDVDQAERERLNYLNAEAKRAAMVGRASHDNAVVGIAIDSLNKTVVTAGADSKLVLWNFVAHMPHKKSPMMLPSSATKLTHVRDSDLAAIAMSDFGVVVFDCSTLTIQYKLSPMDRRMSHTSPISDMQFGPDGRRLFTSSFDGTIRVWDVPTGLCVDWMTFSSPPTSLTLSPTGEFLATSHVGRLGISLWCDKSFFRMVLLDGTPNRPSKMNEPCPVAECEQEGASDVINHAGPYILAKKHDLRCDDPCDENEINDGLPPQAKEHGLITLSGLPPAHWKNLFHLELVKERNKPTEAPQKPPQAPFFLQWRSGLESGTADTSVDSKNISKDSAEGWDAVWSDDDAEGMSEAENSDVNEMESSQESPSNTTMLSKRRKVAHDRSKLAYLLQKCYNAKGVSSMGGQYSDITSYLAKMGPSSIDVEISSLCYGMHDLEEGLKLLHIASMWLLEACESHLSFEAVNAYLHRFLHVHGNIITRMDSILQEEHESLEEQDGVDPQRLTLKVFVETITQLQ
ncbi:hypothetical protein ACHAXA_010640 [Cyclostephanos tholiformis]|uniref:Uncharacterized protein n=2 Tax=Cyclostephanos tholiformis TaxID=382380 RepID=A0ABD3R4L2_9STRA